jgi:hypothetical protein
MLEKVFYTSVLVSDQDEAPDFYTSEPDAIALPTAARSSPL